jgi:hypothetical protein
MRIGLLFDHDFDARAHARQECAGWRFERAGFDLFSFPSNARLIGFDLERFARRQSARARRHGWAGVVSHDEQFGALAAALVAERAGLPGASPESIIACQHKLHMRRVLARVRPEANLRFAELDCSYGDPVPDGLSYPCFAKPVKAAFSVLARRVANRDELQRHTRFGRRELWVIRHLVEPFERIARRRLPDAGTAHRMMVEEVVRAPQYNLDGYVHEGEVRVLGVVDAIMYPGTQSFQRWELPSRLPPAVLERAAEVARRFLREVGFAHGFFNMEFFHDPASDRLAVIEFNPRLASQFGDLYRAVQGIDPHAMALALATGQDPASLPRRAPTAGVASSLVWRAFDPSQVPAMPSRRQQAALAAAFPDAPLSLYPKSGHALARDFKWLDSTRYGVVNLGARDWMALREASAQVSALLGWPDAPFASDAMTVRETAAGATEVLQGAE